jgi:TetR/AcrR family transcriptional repressor of nem operon
MGFSQKHKQRTHSKILDAAGELFRVEGLGGASVDRVMRAAGHTVGGFYGHFDSKEKLVLATLARVLERQMETWLEGLSHLEGAAWAEAFLSRYLTRENRDASLCALPAVVPDVARGGRAVRERFAGGLGSLVDAVAQQIGGAGSRERALGVIAMAFGSLALAKACRGTPLSDGLLRGGRHAAVSLARKPARGPRTARKRQRFEP